MARVSNSLSDSCDIQQLKSVLIQLASNRIHHPEQETLQEPKGFSVCKGPDGTTPPNFVIELRRPVPICKILKPDIDIQLPFLKLGCVRLANSYELSFAVDLRFQQRWNLIKQTIGDISSTMSLAPLEKLTIEFESTLRRVFEQSTIDSAEAMTSLESTTMDKEVLNVTRTSSKTNKWKIDGTGTLSLGTKGNLDLSGGVSSTTTKTAQTTVEQISESTTKSSESLKTLHKIEVKGVSETFVRNRMVRNIQNPYRDRTLGINVFQLLKHFSVETRLSSLMAALILEVPHLEFDKEFVITNSDFLRKKLMDPILIDELPLATQGARPRFDSLNIAKAQKVAKLALRYLFDEPNVFNIPGLPGEPQLLNDPSNTYSVSNFRFEATGLYDAITNKAAIPFTVLNLMYRVYKGLTPDELEDMSIDLAMTLEAELKPYFSSGVADGLLGDNSLKNLFDISDLTEGLRRAPGFVAIVSNMLKPLVSKESDDNDAQKWAESEYALQRLINHLNCNQDYYTQEFLLYISQQTKNLAIVKLAESSIKASNQELVPLLLDLFDIERAFVDGSAVVIPSRYYLSDEDIESIDEMTPGKGKFDVQMISPKAIEVEVPSDGIHMEVFPGDCILPDIPEQPATNFELKVGEIEMVANQN